MKYVITCIVILVACFPMRRLFKIVWQDIKKDPVSNVVIPAATALLTSLLLCLLEMRQ